MNKYPITHNNKKNEESAIKTILNNNSYPQNTIQQKTEIPEMEQETKKSHLHFLQAGN
jgi:hypothetical protein